MRNVHEAKNRQGILLSPNKSKSVEIINILGRSQAMMNFHKNLIVGGSNIVSGNFEKDEVIMEWKDENTLVFKSSKDIKLTNKEEEIYFFGEIVKVNYEAFESR